MVEKDLFGQALYDYWTHNSPEDMITWTHLTEPEVLATDYLFRTFEVMPASEQIALQTAQGYILDVGAGSGLHSLYLQQQQKQVTALELSPISCKLMQERGVQNIINKDFFDLEPNKKFDTILFLMNGIGIVKKARYLDRLFKQIETLLSPNGIALLHSSDLKYLYATESGYFMPENDYYGDVKFFISYKNQIENFDWTYIDENTLRIFAKNHHFKAEKIYESEEGDFLLKIKRKNPLP